MNVHNKCCCSWIPAFAVLGTFLIVGWLAWLMVRNTQPPSINAQRGDERRKALADVRAAEAHGLTKYAWQDQARGIVHLPIDRAKEIALAEWRNPAAARSNLLARVDKATAALPKSGEKPSHYE